MTICTLSFTSGAHAQATSREVLIGVSRVGQPAATPEDAEALYGRASAVLRSGDVSLAQRQLEQLVARYPDSATAERARRDLAGLYGQPRQQAALSTTTRMSHLGAPDATAVPSPLGSGWRTTVRPAAIGFQRSAQDLLREAAGDLVFFSEGSAELGARARKSLSAQAQWLLSNSALPVLVEGHSDEAGTAAELRALALARAEAVRNRLIEEGVSAERIRVMAYGSSRRVAICADLSCASQNRRTATIVGARATAQLP